MALFSKVDSWIILIQTLQYQERDLSKSEQPCSSQALCLHKEIISNVLLHCFRTLGLQKNNPLKTNDHYYSYCEVYIMGLEGMGLAEWLNKVRSSCTYYNHESFRWVQNQIRCNFPFDFWVGNIAAKWSTSGNWITLVWVVQG